MIDTGDAARDWIAVWMGSSPLDQDAFYAYTSGIDECDPNTPICLDLGTFIDVDCWGSWRTADLKPVPIEQLVEEVATSSRAAR